MQTSADQSAVTPVPERRSDWEALLSWVASRLGVVLIALVAVTIPAGERGMAPFLERWRHWDAALLTDIARFGYGGDPAGRPDAGLPAFFPGMPLALRGVHLITGDWTLAGLLISLVAGAIAVVALSRLAEFEGPPGAGRRAVLALVLCPMAVFLFAGYTESLFLAFAIPAWLAARQRRWAAACLLATGASCVRITGLFLACALIVEFARTRAEPRRAGWLALPFLPLAAYSIYQHARTGDWLAWKHAQEAGWGRTLVWPWRSFLTTWNMAVADGRFAWAFRLELIGAAVGVAVVLWLLYRRRWAEFGYVGLQVGALMLSSYYLSIPRAALLWWPLWVGLGRASVRRRWVLAAYAVVAAPLMALSTITFLEGAWVG